MKRIALVLLAGLGLVFASPVAPTAQAHDQANWYNARWIQSDLGSTKIPWSFSPGFWNGQAYRDAVINGAKGWNDIAGNRTLDRQADVSSDPSNVYDCAAALGNNKVWKGAVSDPYYALTGWCVKSGETSHMKSFQMKFRDGINWYAGTGTPGSNELDLWSGATHEFGHGVGQTSGPNGYGHWDEAGDPNSSLCDYTSYPTHVMCYKLLPGEITNAPKIHDRHTFQSAY